MKRTCLFLISMLLIASNAIYSQQKAANAPDVEKLTKLASDLLAYELPTVQGEEAKRVIASTKELLEKVSKFITEKSKSI